ncbi:MAG: hypothetical protein FWH26_09105 [Oscillospiraceae bacterium]|nr:hypothetical protein [Oscillospiraceae bacterium]
MSEYLLHDNGPAFKDKSFQDFLSRKTSPFQVAQGLLLYTAGPCFVLVS